MLRGESPYQAYEPPAQRGLPTAAISIMGAIGVVQLIVLGVQMQTSSALLSAQQTLLQTPSASDVRAAP
eukprot:6201608-Pleurochrysis_carterae.AAC.1